MTFDLGVWKSAPSLTATSASFVYSGLCRGEQGPQVLAAGSAITEFYDELTATWPEVRSQSSKLRSSVDTPWARPLLRAADYVLLSCEWQHAEIVAAYVLGLAGKHGLTVFDPQSEEVYLPDV
jgi:hypothetical protein